MDLTKKERFMISNQLKILEALYPNEANSYAIQRAAFEDGYEAHYNWAMEHINDEPLSDEVTREVIDTLDMYRAIYFYKRKNSVSEFNEFSLKFAGYDGNDPFEYRLMGYSRYFVVELKRFEEILEDQGMHFDFNSHMEMRKNYKKMLDIWLRFKPGVEKGQRHNLTREQLISLVGLE